MERNNTGGTFRDLLLVVESSVFVRNALRKWYQWAGIENVLVAGTKTNVCCEATGRDAMMLDFKVVMVSDCLAALSDEEHRATLETFIQQFGDVMDHREVLALLRNKPN